MNAYEFVDANHSGNANTCCFCTSVLICIQSLLLFGSANDNIQLKLYFLELDFSHFGQLEILLYHVNINLRLFSIPLEGPAQVFE